MPTANDVTRTHVHTWSRKDKAVYCLDCSVHFTEYIAQLEQKIRHLEQKVTIDAMALP